MTLLERKIEISFRRVEKKSKKEYKLGNEVSAEKARITLEKVKTLKSK